MPFQINHFKRTIDKMDLSKSSNISNSSDHLHIILFHSAKNAKIRHFLKVHFLAKMWPKYFRKRLTQKSRHLQKQLPRICRALTPFNNLHIILDHGSSGMMVYLTYFTGIRMPKYVFFYEHTLSKHVA